AALSVVVLQGYSIWTTVLANAKEGGASDPFSLHAWTSKWNGLTPNSSEAEKPSGPAALHASLEATLLLDGEDNPIDDIADDSLGSSIEHIDAPDNQHTVSEITDSELTRLGGETVAASSRTLSGQDSVTEITLPTATQSVRIGKRYSPTSLRAVYR
ncbi:MAG: hypothetical protein MUD03_09105, partial [Pirellula sp.]|nr:hypothetical protein [Pirellula sp.]